MIYRRVMPMYAVRAKMDGQQVQLLFECKNERQALQLAETYIMLGCRSGEIYSVREV